MGRVEDGEQAVKLTIGSMSAKEKVHKKIEEEEEEEEERAPINVNFFFAETQEILVLPSTSLTEVYEQCVSRYANILVEDVKLYFNDTDNGERNGTAVQRSVFDGARSMRSLNIEPGTHFELWWASDILDRKEQRFLTQCIVKNFKKNLGKCIYRASKHGWNRASFNEHCMAKGPVVIVVLAEQGETDENEDKDEYPDFEIGDPAARNKFGAFLSTNIECGAAKGTFKATPYSFLFNIGNRKVFELKPEKTKKGIFFACEGASALISMGGGDLCLYENCHEHAFSFARTPQSFSATIKEFIGCESMYFQVKQLEVFSLLENPNK